MAKVIIITGQSNAHGRGNSLLCTHEELVYHSNCLIWNNGEFQPLKVGSYGNNQSMPGLHGVELPLAMNFQNETIYIIKHAVSGTAIDYSLPGGSVFENLKTNFLQPALNYLVASGIESEVYVYFSQGEADANAISYPVYAKKLSILMENYRNIIGSEVHFIFPEIIETGTLTHDTEINNIFKNAEKNDSKVTVINGKTFSSDDNLHWNYEGVNMLGELIADAVRKNSGAIVKYPLPYSFLSENVKVISQTQKYIGNVDFSESNIIGFPYQMKQYAFIDITLSDSSKSKLNNRYLPFASLTDAINALPADNNTPFVIHFLKGGSTNGCALPFRKLEFSADYPISIDFTNVNQEGQVISSTNPYATATNIVSFDFTTPNIKIVSNYTGIQRFTNGHNFFKLTGSIAFDWKAQGGTNSSFFVVQSKVPTTLEIREWNAYQTHGSYILGFSDNSTIIIKRFINVDLNNKTTFRETFFNTLHNAYIFIESLEMTSGEFRATVPVSIGKIIGNGIINSKSTRFVNCVAADGITFNNINASYVEGELISLNAWKGNASTDLVVKNFDGKMSNIVLTGTAKVITKGNVSIDTTTLITSSVNDAVSLEVRNGITVVNGTIKNNSLSLIVEKGILKNN